ncbi:MAG: tetratricopeptide repeat protein [Deltaproteobacteria bacterium]|nr:tetratricopeptide repeat protein [Deltaproteobacteria bacterium]
MSFIHNALRKAQKEKDGGGGYYNGVASAKKVERPFYSWKWILISLPFLSLLAIIVFSWFNRQHIKSPTIQGKILPDSAAMERPVAKKVEAGRGLYDEALRYQKNGKLQDAKKKYLQALKVSPNLVFALNNLGVIYMSERNYFEARRLFEKAIKLKPDYVDPHYNLACLCVQGNNLSGCVSHLKTAIGLDKRVREWARTDKDLLGLRGRPEYEKVISGK